MLTLDERIARLQAHLRRKPADHQASDKLYKLLESRQRGNAWDAYLKELYPSAAIGSLELRMRAHPLLEMLRPDRGGVFPIV